MRVHFFFKLWVQLRVDQLSLGLLRDVPHITQQLRGKRDMTFVLKTRNVWNLKRYTFCWFQEIDRIQYFHPSNTLIMPITGGT